MKAADVDVEIDQSVDGEEDREEDYEVEFAQGGWRRLVVNSSPPTPFSWEEKGEWFERASIPYAESSGAGGEFFL